MKFLYPAFLFALFTIAIPILIHLFSFRRYTTVYFSNVNYLKNIQKESKKKTRLKHLLMLLARILTIISLVFAFSQPYIPADNQGNSSENQIVTVYIDNSFSMNSLSSGGQLLEEARNKALEIAGTYPAGTSFRLVTNDHHPRHQHLFNKEQFILQITDIKPSSRSVRLSQINSRIHSGYSYPASVSGASSAATSSYYLSDFQASTSDLENFRSDSLFLNYFIPLRPGTTSNLYIDSCWMETPAHKLGQEEQLNVRIVNQSDEEYQNLPVKFYLNDSLKALANFDIEPRSEETVTLRYMNLSTGIQSGYAEISDYPVTHDNTYYLNYNVLPELRLLVIYSSAFRGGSGLRWLRALFSEDDYVKMEEMTMENLTISRLAEFNSIILMNVPEISTGVISELSKAAENGTSIVFFPEPDGIVSTYNEFLSRFEANRIERFDTTKQQLGGIEWEHPVYSQVFRERSSEIDFPEIKGNFVFSSTVRINEIPLLWFRNGEKALSTQPAGRGNLVVAAFPLSSVNEGFARHILFVPTIYSLIINSLPYQKLAYKIGVDTYSNFPGKPGTEINAWSVILPETKETYIPEIITSEENTLRINLTDVFHRAGHYPVLAGQELAGAISLNYDRSESDLRFLDDSQLKNEIEKYNLKYTSIIQNQEGRFSDVFEEITNGKRIWLWFVILALLFIATEAAIARFWK
jgi:hypothetical protein